MLLPMGERGAYYCLWLPPHPPGAPCCCLQESLEGRRLDVWRYAGAVALSAPFQLRDLVAEKTGAQARTHAP